MFAGFFAGIMYDLFYSGLFGFTALIFIYIGYFSGFFYQKYEEAAAGNPEAQARYENFLAARRENYHKKKQDEKGEQIA